MINSKKQNEIVIEKNVPVVHRFCQHGWRRGMKFTVRKQDEGYRIWRKE